MSQLLSNHPIKVTIATAIVVLISIISMSISVATQYTKMDNRVANIEDDFNDYQLKDMPVLKETVTRIDETVQLLLKKN